MKKVFLIFSLLVVFMINAAAQFILDPNTKTIYPKLPGYTIIGNFKLEQNPPVSLAILDSIIVFDRVTKKFKTHKFAGTLTGSATLNELLTNKITGGHRSTSTSKYYNAATVNALLDSLAALKAGTASPTFTGPITGDEQLRGTSSFDGTATKKSIYIAGATASDVYVVTPVMATSATRPDFGDVLAYYAVTDSLVVARISGTVSSTISTFGWHRFK